MTQYAGLPNGGKPLSHESERRARAPMFSIVTAVLNGAATLRATIESVQAQQFRDYEYIVLDGGSSDDTLAILHSERHVIDYWESKRDGGIYNAWNRGIELSRGRWIAFLGSDDAYFADALSHYAAAIAGASDRDPQYVSSKVLLTRGGKGLRTVGAAWSWPAFAHHMTVAHVGSVHNRSLFQEFGPFNEQYRVCGDYELLLRPRDRLRACFVDRVTASMEIGGASNRNIRLALAEQESAKRTTGGRAAWLCALERGTAHVRHRIRSMVWY